MHVEKTTYDRLQRIENISNSVSCFIICFLLTFSTKMPFGRANILLFQLVLSGLSKERITAKACFDWYMQKVGTKTN